MLIVYLGEPPEQLRARLDTEVTTQLPARATPAPDCLVVDLSANALQTVVELTERWPDTPVIVVLDADTTPEEAVESGATDFVQRSVLADHTDVFAQRLTAYGEQGASEHDQLSEFDDIDTVELATSGEITAISEPLATLLGSAPEQLRGETLSDVLAAVQMDQQPGTGSSLDGVEELQPGRRSELFVEGPSGETNRLQVYPVSNGGEEMVAIVQDVTQYHDRIQELTLYEKITEAVPDPLYYVDEDGIVRELNPAMTDVYEFSYDELTGSYFGKATTEEGERKLYDAVRTMLSDDNDIEAQILEYDALSGTGKAFPVAHHISVLESNGEFDGTVGLIRDITERTERQQRLQVINRLLRHNVRNRFTLIIGEASTLIDDVNPEHRDRIQTVLDHSWKTVDMIEKTKKAGDLLNERPHTKQVSVPEAIDSATDRFEHSTANITVSAPDDLTVYAIPGLTFALENLIENAIEHNRSATPLVEITATGDEQWVTIEVADNGEGIPASERDVIESGTEDPLEHGSGIGLWIVSWIVQRSRGRVEFDRSDLGGASVRLVLRAGA